MNLIGNSVEMSDKIRSLPHFPASELSRRLDPTAYHLSLQYYRTLIMPETIGGVVFNDKKSWGDT